MKMNKWVQVFAFGATIVLLSGCASTDMSSANTGTPVATSHYSTYSGDLVAGPDVATAVEQEPAPAPKPETVPPSPGPDYVWVGGHWVWHNGWEWQPGYWSIGTIASRGVYVPGRWVLVNGVQTWYPGYWM